MFGCLFVPDFSMQAALRLEPQDTRLVLKRSPIAVLDGPSNLPRVVALNDAARSAGIQTGMTKLQVEVCSGVWIQKRSVEHEDAAQAALLECASAFSPRVESTGPGTVILDLSGTEKLFGSPEKTAHRIALNASALGFDLHIGIASNPDTALNAARGFRGITVIPEGEEAKRLASLCVEVLPLSSEMLEVLESWGIMTFQSLAELPSIPLAQRLGEEGLYFQKLAQGHVNRPLKPVEPAAAFIESFEFEDPVETLESLFFVLNRLMQEICARLMARSLATNELRLVLELEVRQILDGQDREQFRREWKLPVPAQDRNMLYKLISLDLENNTFSAPIKKLTVEVVPVKPRMAQGNLFAPPSPEAEKLEITLARIRGVVGSTDEDGVDCVGSPRLQNTHRSGSFTVQSFSSVSEISRPSSVVAPVAALRIFRPALETSVELDGEMPHFVWLWRKHRRVLAASGPWCTSGHWWSGSAWAREEWDLALKMSEGIGYYRICFDRLRQQWFVEGVFD